MFRQLAKYKNNDNFFYKKGDDILKLSQNLPNKPGVFYILKLAKSKINIVYIGKSDSSKTNSKTLNSLFYDREKGISLHEYFDKKIENENIDALDIYWFDTEDDDPSDVANEILQDNYNLFGSLPVWNKSFK